MNFIVGCGDHLRSGLLERPQDSTEENTAGLVQVAALRLEKPDEFLISRRSRSMHPSLLANRKGCRYALIDLKHSPMRRFRSFFLYFFLSLQSLLSPLTPFVLFY